MSRINGIGGTFPYSEDGNQNPATAGLIVGSNIETGVIAVPVPSKNFVDHTHPEGKMEPYLGETTLIYPNHFGHAQLTGSS
jgi:hypothetical protein